MEQTQAAKSLVIILYQLVTEHVTALQKWASLKAYTILNALEIVFWAAVAILTIQANVQMCVAPGCILGWGVAITGINLSVLAIYATIICYPREAISLHQDTTVFEAAQVEEEVKLTSEL
ncbi:hypothetical protein G4B84_011484 [Aspergillus flavus NRRL3357]|nr:uncharacterized protein G4B84_011484 [Aspergillus flavus NRRL3357]QMW35955.1 hypothetical protein G4B84_011484 [Aspergillus flavus NRRL3357]QMW48017.1 hypothetical protein G4B11_011535 [Aspergillus flavus]